MRPLYAPRAADTVPRWRARRNLRRRTLAARIDTLAERRVCALEAAPRIDLAGLREALELIKLGTLADRPYTRRHRTAELTSELDEPQARARDRRPARQRRRHRPRAVRGAGGFHRELRGGGRSGARPDVARAQAVFEAEERACKMMRGRVRRSRTEPEDRPCGPALYRRDAAGISQHPFASSAIDQA